VSSKLLKCRGVSLIEVMISLVVLLIVFMGLIQASLLSIQFNTRNLLRDEAVAVTADQMSNLRSASFDDMNRDGVTDGATLLPANFAAANFPVPVRRLRNDVSVTFNVDRTVNTLDASSKQITVTTNWTWQGDPFTHQIITARRR